MPKWYKGNDAIFAMATTPPQQWQGCLHIDNGNNVIIMRTKIAMVMMAKMHAH
jgi:hypothetical protein